MVLWYLSHNCKLSLVEIQGKHDRLAEFRRGPRHSGFGLAKQKLGFECDRKLTGLHQTIIKQCQHHRPQCSGFTLWGSPDVEWHPSSINPSAVVAMFVIYWLPEETSSDTDVSFFNFKRSLDLNSAMNVLGLKLDLSYSLSSKFRSLTRNKY